MNGLNAIQADAFALLQGRAVRREAWRRWRVYRHHGWYSVEWTAEGLEVWRPVLNRDMTKADYEQHDFTTELWEGGTLPACCPTDQPSKLPGNATGGAGSYGSRDDCGGLSLAIFTGSTGEGGSSGFALPVLDSIDIVARAERAPYPSGITTGRLVSGGPLGYLTFPTDYLGAVELAFRFVGGDIGRVYVWLQVGAAPTGSMAPPYAFEVDGISALPDAFGPVRAFAVGAIDLFGGSAWEAGDEYVNEAGFISTPALGEPRLAFAHLPLQPGDVIHVRLDAIVTGAGRLSYLSTHTLPDWIEEPKVLTFGAAWSVEPDGSYIDPGPDMTLDTEDDVVVACWIGGGAGSMDLNVTVTMTGGKPVMGLLTLKIDGVAVVTNSTTRGANGSATIAVYDPDVEHTYEATWTAPADEYGPAVTYTDGGSIFQAPTCP